MKNKRPIIIGIVAIVVCIVAFALLYWRFSPRPASGAKAYVLEVSDGNRDTAYSGKTDAAYLSELLEEVAKTEAFDFESMNGDYGMYITSVNGVRAGEDEKTYWAIYVNGEYGQYGADSQPVNDGDSFALRLESYE